MQQFTDNRHSDTPDEIWLLQHQPVFTQGQAGKEEHLLFPGDIPVVKVDRGGQVTYHGPGQLVVYVLLDIKRRQLGVRNLVTMLEQILIELLQRYQINAAAKADAPGVYVDGAKIASLGLRVRKGCTFHGLALNVDMDLTPFQRINPCGYAGMQMIRSADLGGPQSIAEASKLIAELFQQHLAITVPVFKTGLEN
ncbi:lipoyl(octanoyl) transferase LipB [Rheinheimera sp. UJ63]|nr:lipoyl(octanoyl) transferase LipB [Rheinheimera sp. UJ63]